MEVLIRYLCWGCGAEKDIYEEIEEIVDAMEIEQWNLCPSCQEGEGDAKEKEKVV